MRLKLLARISRKADNLQKFFDFADEVEYGPAESKDELLLMDFALVFGRLQNGGWADAAVQATPQMQRILDRTFKDEILKDFQQMCIEALKLTNDGEGSPLAPDYPDDIRHRLEELNKNTFTTGYLDNVAEAALKVCA